MKKYLTVPHVLTMLFFNAALIACIYFVIQLQKNSVRLKKAKADYFAVNQIKCGLLNADSWTYQINTLISAEIDSFELTRSDEKTLRKQVDRALNRFFDEVETLLHEKQHKVKDNLKFKVINSFVDIDKFRADIPRFSNAIIAEIVKSENKEKVKFLLKEKINAMLVSKDRRHDIEKEKALSLHHCVDISSFNTKMTTYINKVEQQQRQYGYVLIALMSLVGLVWFLFIIQRPALHTLAFIYSVLISFANLYTGVTLPMIEIDARIAELNIHLLSSNIVFTDQVVFFQSKSIYDVISILITAGNIDSVFVGSLVCVFSVIFPIFKSVFSIVYLFAKEKSNAFIEYMALKSGKWSMADVMLVAIFMAYLGFQAILNAQLNKLEVDHDGVNTLTTNKSSLQIGFLVFTCFVIYNLILSEALRRITKKSRLEY